MKITLSTKHIEAICHISILLGSPTETSTKSTLCWYLDNDEIHFNFVENILGIYNGKGSKFFEGDLHLKLCGVAYLCDFKIDYGYYGYIEEK